MSKRLDENLGSVGYDGLIVANEPIADVFTVTIRKEATAAAAYKRGTVLALSAGTAGDGKLVILGSTATTNETLTANCILAEDVEVGTTADVTESRKILPIFFLSFTCFSFLTSTSICIGFFEMRCSRH